MIAIPVARPGRSGNHLISVETGEMYPRPRPMPPMTPYPRYTSHSWLVAMPSAPTRNPDDQTDRGGGHRAARAARVDPGAEDSRADSEHHDRDREDDPDRGQRGVEVRRPGTTCRRSSHMPGRCTGVRRGRRVGSASGCTQVPRWCVRDPERSVTFVLPRSTGRIRSSDQWSGGRFHRYPIRPVSITSGHRGLLPAALVPCPASEPGWAAFTAHRAVLRRFGQALSTIDATDFGVSLVMP